VIRKVFIFILCFFNVSAFAAPDVVSQYLSSSPTPWCNPNAAMSSAPNFCATFPPAATCNCENHGMTPGFCSVMTNIYCSMLKTYDTLENACNHQNVTNPAECVADWNCYWLGGKSSKDGKSCNSTGVRCTSDPQPTKQSCPK
jgi:hypothetical protein